MAARTGSGGSGNLEREIRRADYVGLLELEVCQPVPERKAFVQKNSSISKASERD